MELLFTFAGNLNRVAARIPKFNFGGFCFNNSDTGRENTRDNKEAALAIVRNPLSGDSCLWQASPRFEGNSRWKIKAFGIPALVRLAKNNFGRSFSSGTKNSFLTSTPKAPTMCFRVSMLAPA